MADVTLPTAEIIDFDSFHSVFAKILGFPPFYGRNMDAWIDCMSCLDDKDAGLASVWVGEGERLLIEIPETMALKQRAPDVFNELIECTALVNARYVQRGVGPVVGLLLA